MDSIKATGDRVDDHGVGAGDGWQAGPMVPRLLLGARLRRLREARGLSGDEAAQAIRASASKLCRLELGRSGCKPRDVADLLTLYGVTDEAERATVLALAEQANAPAWWQSFHDVIPMWLQTYLGLEQAAAVIRSYEVRYIPGLLQTADYARAVVCLEHADAPGDEVDRRVELRMRRQQVLHRAQVPHMWAVIDEAALRRPFGGADVMRAQLEHLITVNELPHVTVQVLPFKAGGHAAIGGPVTVLRLPGGELPDVVYLEQLTGAVYPDRPAELLRYRHVMNSLVTQARSPRETTAILGQIIDES